MQNHSNTLQLHERNNHAAIDSFILVNVSLNIGTVLVNNKFTQSLFLPLKAVRPRNQPLSW